MVSLAGIFSTDNQRKALRLHEWAIVKSLQLHGAIDVYPMAHIKDIMACRADK